MQKKIFGKCLFAYKIRFAVEKNTKKIWGKFSKLLERKFVSPSKNAIQKSYNFHIWKL